MDDVTITVNIADRPYRLKIKKEEEEVIKKAVKEIDARLKDYSEKFNFQDKQDLLAMAILHFSATAIKAENERTVRENSLYSKLKKLDQVLSEQLV